MESAAMHYKEIVGLAGQAAEELRAWEVRRAQELETEIAAAEQAVAEAAHREQRTAQVAHNWWRMAEDNVSRLPWLEVADGPAPAANARGAWLDRYLNELKPIYQELVDSVLSLGWRARR
ncbi:hypothetical protein [Amycolatopsis alkalitolerans]|uniref:Uncharacterized protein n=1 Tax=Amycolatopsis alkalitolerans TaxID=2547244 RepID=A0A5C4M7K2_9PSEU|nr:hypothetical protein [Amycolatopsis alkalitolerans]TNC28496.1 hypothetical protein FG385_04250 [Amycolatopsis alkalitolerans]